MYIARSVELCVMVDDRDSFVYYIIQNPQHMKSLHTYISESALSRHDKINISIADIFKDHIKKYNVDRWLDEKKFDSFITCSGPHTIDVHKNIYLTIDDLEFAIQSGIKKIVLHNCGLIFVDADKTKIDCKSQLTIRYEPPGWNDREYKWIMSPRGDHEFVGINFEASKVTNLIYCGRLSTSYTFPSFVNCRFRNIILSYDELNSSGGPVIADKLKNCKFDGWCYLSLNTKDIADKVINSTGVISVNKNSKMHLDYVKSAVETYAAEHSASDILNQLTGGAIQKLSDKGIVRVDVFCEHAKFKFYKEDKITFTSQKKLLKYGVDTFTMKDGVFMQIVGSDTEWKAKFAQWWEKDRFMGSK